VKIRRLYISEGHNYFGHHGREPDSHPSVEQEQVQCVAGQGISGDRFFGYKKNYRGQITFFSWEVFEAMRAELNLPEVSPGLTRRNVIVEDADLNSLIGVEFEIQGVRFFGESECSPCHWMDRAFAPGAEHFLKNRGGLRARILMSGTLRAEG